MRDASLGVITILAIAGTLSACGRYGSPVRVHSEATPVGPTSDLMEGPDEAEEKELEDIGGGSVAEDPFGEPSEE